jgi:hypothetical protein
MSDSLDHDFFEVYFIADLTIMELLMWKAECHIMFAAIVVLVLKCELVIADLFMKGLA